MKRVAAAVAVAVLVGLVVGSGALESGQADSTPANAAGSAPRVTAIPPIGAAHEQPAVITNGPEKHAESGSSAAAHDLKQLQAALRDPNPYAAYVALLNARRPGSFAQASWLRGSCIASFHAVYAVEEDARRVARGEAPQVALSVDREQAAAEAKSRCGYLSGVWDDDQPLEGDADGRAFRAADKRLIARAPFQKDEWSVLAEQGSLYLVGMGSLPADTDTAPRYFEGVRYAEDAQARQVYNHALRLAAWYATAGDHDTQQPNLMELIYCMDTGRCHSSHPEDEVLSDLPPDSPLRARIMALYPRVLAAMQRCDVSAFVPPPGAGAVTARP